MPTPMPRRRRNPTYDEITGLLAPSAFRRTHACGARSRGSRRRVVRARARDRRYVDGTLETSRHADRGDGHACAGGPDEASRENDRRRRAGRGDANSASCSAAFVATMRRCASPELCTSRWSTRRSRRRARRSRRRSVAASASPRPGDDLVDLIERASAIRWYEPADVRAATRHVARFRSSRRVGRRMDEFRIAHESRRRTALRPADRRVWIPARGRLPGTRTMAPPTAGNARGRGVRRHDRRRLRSRTRSISTSSARRPRYSR